jgi:predicted outer membrane protein
MRSSVPVLILFAGFVVACGDGGRAADSARAAQREDSIRRLGAAAWDDGQLIAYVKVASTTLVADGPLVERRARAAAVRSFGRTVVSDHRRVLRLADSLEARRNAVVPPLVSSEVLQEHEAVMRRLARDGPFDTAYVRSTRAVLEEVAGQLAKADSTRHTGAVHELLRRTRTALRSELRTAAALPPRPRAP